MGEKKGLLRWRLVRESFSVVALIRWILPITGVFY